MSSRESGFTLIEVIIAFAIVSLALVGLYGALSNSYRNASAVRVRDEATAVGKSMIQRLGRDLQIGAGPWSGRLSDGSPWTVVVTEIAPEPGAPQRLYRRGVVVFEALTGDGRRPVRLQSYLIERSR